MTDIRATQAQKFHQLASSSDKQSAQYRKSRNELVRELRDSDPKLWTYRRLAEEVGCSWELIAHIIKRSDA